jgi:hypothetical protein
MLRVEMMPSLWVITTGLSSFTLRQSTSIWQPMTSLRTAVRRGLEKCFGTMHSSTRKRCDDSYGFVFDAHFGDMQVIELNPSFYLGYQLKHTVLHGVRRYDEAIEAFKSMLSKLDKAPDTQTQSMSPNRTPFNIVDCLSRLAPTVY